MPALFCDSSAFPGAADSGKMAEDRGLAEEKALNMTPFPPLSPNLPPKMECHSNRRPIYAEERRARRDGCVRCDPRGAAELKLIHYPPTAIVAMMQNGCPA